MVYINIIAIYPKFNLYFLITQVVTILPSVCKCKFQFSSSDSNGGSSQNLLSIFIDTFWYFQEFILFIYRFMSSPLDRRRLSQIFVDFIYGQERASNNQQHTHTQNLLAKLNFFFGWTQLSAPRADLSGGKKAPLLAKVTDHLGLMCQVVARALNNK